MDSLLPEPWPPMSHSGPSWWPHTQTSVSQHCLGHAKDCFWSLHGQQKESLKTLQKILHLTTIHRFLFGTFSLFFFMETVKWKQTSTRSTGLGTARISDMTCGQVIWLYICVVYKRHTHEGVVWSVMNPNTGAVNFIEGHRHVKNIFTHVSICRLPWTTWVFN